jgi:hypothetical protein
MAYVDVFSEEDFRNYEKSEDIIEIGVYCKKNILEHKVTLVRKLDMARWNLTEPRNNNEEYNGVYWAVPFNKFGMDLESFISWRDNITTFDPVSIPMVIGYSGHLRRIWFASEKHWQGFFKVEAVVKNKIFICNWNPLQNPEEFPRSQFQGYTTRVPELSLSVCDKCGGSGMDYKRFDEFLNGIETLCNSCHGHGYSFIQVVK